MMIRQSFLARDDAVVCVAIIATLSLAEACYSSHNRPADDGVAGSTTENNRGTTSETADDVAHNTVIDEYEASDKAGSNGREAICGDGIITYPEQCDGLNIGNQTCTSLGEGKGSLACDPNSCSYDGSGCNQEVHRSASCERPLDREPATIYECLCVFCEDQYLACIADPDCLA